MAPEQREYDRVELVWPGKRTEVERVRLPFQTIERVNDVRGTHGAQGGLLTTESQLPDWWPDGWRNRLIWGDNKYVLASLLDEFAGKVDLIYIDPPFATGADFSYEVKVGNTEIEKLPSAIEEVAYRDTWRGGSGSYLQMMYERLVLMKDLLAPNGSIFVHCDWHMMHLIRVLLDGIFGEAHFRNEIVWRYRRWPAKTNTFQKMHDTIFWYTKSEPSRHTFNQLYEPLAASTLETWGTRKQVADFSSGRRKPSQTEEETAGALMSDVWDIGIIAPIAHERVGYATQKPEALLDRLLGACTESGDLVCDFFAGSGTSAVVAEKLGRRWISADIGRFAVQTTRKRLLDIPGCRPFELMNLGRYERRYWAGMTVGETVWEYYRFVLDLFGAQPISGFAQLHGQRDGRFVHVGATDAPVTFDEVERTLEECSANGLKAVDILGWEWEMGLNPAGKDDLARKHGVDVRLFHIPREVMDKRAVEAGDVHFFELSVARLQSYVDGREASIELTGFLPAIDEYMRQKVGDKATKWSDWIDYWSVDFEYDGETYINQWQSYRTRKDPKLELRSAPHVYEKPGTYQVSVKVIDIFGNDTTQQIAVTIK